MWWVHFIGWVLSDGVFGGLGFLVAARGDLGYFSATRRAIREVDRQRELTSRQRAISEGMDSVLSIEDRLEHSKEKLALEQSHEKAVLALEQKREMLFKQSEIISAEAEIEESKADLEKATQAREKAQARRSDAAKERARTEAEQTKNQLGTTLRQQLPTARPVYGPGIIKNAEREDLKLPEASRNFNGYRAYSTKTGNAYGLGPNGEMYDFGDPNKVTEWLKGTSYDPGAVRAWAEAVGLSSNKIGTQVGVFNMILSNRERKGQQLASTDAITRASGILQSLEDKKFKLG